MTMVGDIWLNLGNWTYIMTKILTRQQVMFIQGSNSTTVRYKISTHKHFPQLSFRILPSNLDASNLGYI